MATQVIERIVALTPIREDSKIVWHGLDSHIEHRTVYKALNLKINVPTEEVEKWLALLACIAASTALTVWLASIAFGPVGWAVVAQVIIVSAAVCFSQIMPDKFKVSDGTANVIEHAGDWHRV